MADSGHVVLPKIHGLIVVLKLLEACGSCQSSSMTCLKLITHYVVILFFFISSSPWILFPPRCCEVLPNWCSPSARGNACEASCLVL
jgi:hypothetical protein